MTRLLESKRRLITAFFDAAESRIDYLTEIHAGGHKPEAMTLCLTYIDSFAQWLSGSQKLTCRVGRNFVCALVEFGRDPLMGFACPFHLICVLSEMKPPWQRLGEKIKTVFSGRIYELLPMPDFKQELLTHLQEKEFREIEPELWRSTIASIVYERLRNPSIHNFGSSSGILLSGVFYQGRSMPPYVLSTFG